MQSLLQLVYRKRGKCPLIGSGRSRTTLLGRIQSALLRRAIYPLIIPMILRSLARYGLIRDPMKRLRLRLFTHATSAVLRLLVCFQHCYWQLRVSPRVLHTGDANFIKFSHGENFNENFPKFIFRARY